jgi:hypothetical protein
MAITELFNEAEMLAQSAQGGATLAGILRFKDASHLYDRCKELQALADAADE